jgi:glutamate/tyrosine decarboxylase-like PLP-dependent enzyme
MDEITALERLARPLEPDALERDRLLRSIIDYTNHFLAAIPHMPTYVARPDNGRAIRDSPITEEGMDIAEALTLLHDNVDTLGVNLTSERYFGYIPGGGLFHAALGDYLAAITNRYAGLFFVSPGAVRIENVLLRWMADLFGYPPTAAGNLTSGGSLANLTAIITARDAFGISGELIPKSVVYLTEHTHHCIGKALHVAGLAGCITRQVRLDANYRMDPTDLERLIRADSDAGLRPWLVVASAGTTSTGAVDPLARIGEITAKHSLWFHVDGAYGGFFVLCEEGQTILHGIDTSDSLVLDPHKSLFLPYGSGAVVVKDRQRLYAAFNADADYIQNILDQVDESSPADLSLELTKHFRGLRLWLPLKVLGIAPFRAALAEKIHLARYFYEQLQRIDGFEVGPYPDLSIVTYRYLPKRGNADAFNQRLMQALQRDGTIFVSSTRVEHKLVLRAAIVSYRTHVDAVNEAIAVLASTAKQLEQE